MRCRSGSKIPLVALHKEQLVCHSFYQFSQTWIFVKDTDDSVVLLARECLPRVLETAGDSRCVLLGTLLDKALHRADQDLGHEYRMAWMHHTVKRSDVWSTLTLSVTDIAVLHVWFLPSQTVNTSKNEELGSHINKNWNKLTVKMILLRPKLKRN